MVANTFLGPPLGAALLVVAFSVPFFVDAASFAVAAVLITLISPATMLRSTAAAPTGDRRPWKEELVEGFRWLWNHELIRNLAIEIGSTWLADSRFIFFGGFIILMMVIRPEGVVTRTMQDRVASALAGRRKDTGEAE